MGRRWCAVLFVLIGLLMVPVVARPANAADLEMDYQTTLWPGIRFMTLVSYSPPAVINVIQLLPRAPEAITVVPASRSGGGTASVAALCARAGAIACINGDMFNRYGTLGGELVNGWWVKFPTLERQQVWVDAGGFLSANTELPTSIQSFGATPYNLLTPGAPIDIPEHDNFSDAGYARTLVGWDGANNRFFVTVEQGQGSAGMSLTQAAEMMQKLGATTAVNEDGGGSSDMVVVGRSHVAAGQWARPVASAIAIVKM